MMISCRYNRMQLYSQYNHSQEEDIDLSSVLRIQNLELALEKAVSDITLLQDNLAYVIRVKEELEADLTVRERREQVIIQQFEKELHKKEREMEGGQEREEEMISLLKDTKDSLEGEEIARRQREDEVRRMERIIEDQKSTLHALEEELLAVKYSADLSFQNMTQDNGRLQELESEVNQLEFELQKAKVKTERQTDKVRKLQKEVDHFKGWLASMVGVRKVVEGCEGMLMTEISNRLSNCPQL